MTTPSISAPSVARALVEANQPGIPAEMAEAVAA